MGKTDELLSALLMQQNVGDTDRLVRIVVGVALVVIALAGFLEYLSLSIGPISNVIGAAFVAIVGVVLLGTAYTRQCALYQVIGVDTK